MFLGLLADAGVGWRRSRLRRSTQAHSPPSSFPSSSSHPAPGGRYPPPEGGGRPGRRAGVGAAAVGGGRRGPLPRAPLLPPPAPRPSSSPSSPSSSSRSPAAAARGSSRRHRGRSAFVSGRRARRAQRRRPRGDGGGCEDRQSWKNGRGAGPASPPPLSPPSPSPPTITDRRPSHYPASSPPPPPSHLPVHCQLCQPISFASGNTWTERPRVSAATVRCSSNRPLGCLGLPGRGRGLRCRRPAQTLMSGCLILAVEGTETRLTC
ncbi:proline-rich proteoglycan 2-like [Phodopus roborovskii]|uniref:proline-rich proteoglycan 2-like n=1 Tax=Phodopus roborovskii TaxID=109678 RepID=UPI0021E3E588|nr:proline-rich proteoglycan 2-like [Phodopus roborovskii]